VSVSTKEQVVVALSRHRHDLQQFGLRSCGVFGSFARNQQQSGSDIDILVEFEPGKKTFDNFMQLAWFLEALLGRRIDLVTIESLSPHIGPHILREVEYVPLIA
jgi:uncharacterized protein